MAERRNRIRVLMVKPGLDGHWRGAMVVSMALRDAGMEVIYGGNQAPENIVGIAIQEDVDVIGLSSYSAGHLKLITEVMGNLRKKNAGHILVVVGGVIPHMDIPILKEEGVGEVFPPGSSPVKIVDYIEKNATPRG
jgi:methylmalonyl-CoA mutase C-terminal domain/subunit